MPRTTESASQKSRADQPGLWDASFNGGRGLTGLRPLGGVCTRLPPQSGAAEVGESAADTGHVIGVAVLERAAQVLRCLLDDSTDDEILAYTSQQSAKPRVFPVDPPPIWMVFVREGGDRARLWSVVENRGEVSNDGALRTFDLVVSERMADLRNRLVIGWRSPRTWRLNGPTASGYPVMEIADAQPVPFPGFDRLVLDLPQLQAVMREHRYASWRTALSSVVGVYLITDTRDGRQYVGKADGAESIRQR